MPTRPEPVPLPDTLSQLWLDLTRHLPVDETLTLLLREKALIDQWLDGEIVNLGGACDTVILIVDAPRASMITVALRT